MHVCRNCVFIVQLIVFCLFEIYLPSAFDMVYPNESPFNRDTVTPGRGDVLRPNTLPRRTDIRLQKKQKSI